MVSIVDQMFDRMMDEEKQKAVILAGIVLDRPNADPDDDLAILARQFLRAMERLGEYEWPR